jgi:DNA-binding GntR family transcriptional regulator
VVKSEISRELLSDQVYDLIRASILDGSRVPGSRLVESEIARQLSVSQAPVREAVKRLVHEGLLTSVPRNGSFVTEVSPEEFEVARQMRAALERFAAEATVPLVNDALVATLTGIVERMHRAVVDGDWADFRSADMDFHRTVLTHNGLSVLKRLWVNLEPLLLSSGALGNPAFPGDRQAVVGWHLELIAALESGDAARAGAAFHEHAVGGLTH